MSAGCFFLISDAGNVEPGGAMLTPTPLDYAVSVYVLGGSMWWHTIQFSSSILAFLFFPNAGGRFFLFSFVLPGALMIDGCLMFPQLSDVVMVNPSIVTPDDVDGTGSTLLGDSMSMIGDSMIGDVGDDSDADGAMVYASKE